MTKPNFSLVVLLSGHGSNLQAIIEACAKGQLLATVVAVISDNPKAYGLKRAQTANIPTICLNSKDYNNSVEYELALQETIDQHHPDLVVLAGFMRVLGKAFVQHYRWRMVNIHPSLLPKYRGLHTHARALAAQESHHGTTIHFVTEELDGGPIIAQTICEISADDTEDSLMNKVKNLEHQILPYILALFARGAITIENEQIFIFGNPITKSGVLLEAHEISQINL